MDWLGIGGATATTGLLVLTSNVQWVGERMLSPRGREWEATPLLTLKVLEKSRTEPKRDLFGHFAHFGDGWSHPPLDLENL